MVAGSAALKTEVKAFWNQQSCETQYAESQKFTREYFEQIEQWRYADQPFIHSFAQFTRYHDKRVLEVGFGAGTDFIQWLRAGALASGIDLTEEAFENLSHRIQVYGLPAPQQVKVGDAENLPFSTGTFDLGYSWGVLHHTPNTEKSISELIRVVKPGGEIKIMLYNRHSLLAYKTWLKQALLKGRPWKSLRWCLWNYIESVGTKGYTHSEIRQILAPLGVKDIRLENFVTSADRIQGSSFPARVCDAFLGAFVWLTGSRFGWFTCVSGRKGT